MLQKSQFKQKRVDNYKSNWLSLKLKKLLHNKKIDRKESFQFFHIPVILIGSFYRKNENCYPKVFLEKLIHDFFGEKNFFWLLGFWTFLLKIFFEKIQELFQLVARKFHFHKYKKSVFLKKYKKVLNLVTKTFHFLKYKKIFFLRKYKNLF